MIHIQNKSLCCGCAACANACPKGAISMQPDEEGFLYPHVDSASCVNCGLCEKVCPVLHPPFLPDMPAAYAAKLKDTVSLSKSSSGGMFTALAQPILEKGGVVFGAGFDKDWNVCHQYAETLKDLDKLRRSKYVQSDIGKTFQQAKQFLDKGRQVLFTGTPCQIVGLKNYLGKDYENLLTVDIICHGVPSPGVWQKFLEENFSNKPITAIDFRDKTIGWDASYLSITVHGKEVPMLPLYLRPFKKLFFARKGYLFRSLFCLSFFISNLYERPSCHKCHFKGSSRAADFTIGDLWGIQYICPHFYDKKGVSALLINTPKGKCFFEQIQNSLLYESVPLELLVKYNPYYATSVSEHPKRAEFFARYQKEPLNKLIPALLSEKILPIQILQHIYRRLFCVLHRS